MNWKVLPMLAFMVSSLLFFALAENVVAQPAPPAEKLPWTLREHYTFPGGPLRLDYAKDNAEWRIKVYQEDSETSRMNPDVVLHTVGFSVAVKDGPVLTNDMLGAGGETIMAREPHQTDFVGEGTAYTVRFVPQEDLVVEHTITTFRRWNFLFLTVKVTNQGAGPKNILKISPAIIASHAFEGLSDAAVSSARPLMFRGPYPVFGPEGQGTALRIYDAARPLSLMMAFLPSGFAACRYASPSGGSNLEGSFECDYAPGYALQPGDSITSNPIFISFGFPPAMAQSQYDYLLSNACAPAVSGELPRAWVTVPDTEGLAVLRAEAGNAVSAGITHALIPDNWEGRPGTLEGGAPKYPRNIAEAASSLSGAGCTPGITVDPLLAHKGSGAWTAQSEDGQYWVNLNTAEGKEYAVSRLKKLIDKGFGFLVIEASTIPDAVLEHFGLTRAQADAYAFAAAGEAAGASKAVVMPSSAAKINLTRDALLDAASAAVQLRERNIGMAAITAHLAGSGSLDDETLLALQLLGCPVEFIGAPARSAQSGLARVFAQAPLRARAQDTPRKAPLVWMLMPEPAARGGAGDALFCFSGAPGWETAALENSDNAMPESALLWQPAEGRTALLNDGRVPASEKYAVFGLVPDPNQPVLAGISGVPFLGMDRIKKCTWSPETRILAGEIAAVTGDKATAHIYVPQTFAVASAKLNGKDLRPDASSQWLSMPLESGGGAFEITFSSR
ncbi:MAG TPA: hypothetical protein PKO23_02710 [Candidatus Hydrogenedentes bacterium]|nr:MAG: hypothetical protein BWY09_00823 [Candidatus Hydrogenedentes bacterium ADurb.Bin179]HOC67697.1 hypothetical protein [Candidatus Hydrogenedentota bacterium]